MCQTCVTGPRVYRKFATSMQLGLEQVGAHYAISSIFRNYPEEGALFCYNVTRTEHELLASGRGRLAIGRAQLNSRITEECEEIAYAVLHLGDQNLSAAVKRCDTGDETQLAAFSHLLGRGRTCDSQGEPARGDPADRSLLWRYGLLAYFPLHGRAAPHSAYDSRPDVVRDGGVAAQDL